MENTTTTRLDHPIKTLAKIALTAAPSQFDLDLLQVNPDTNMITACTGHVMYQAKLPPQSANDNPYIPSIPFDPRPGAKPQYQYISAKVISALPTNKSTLVTVTTPNSQSFEAKTTATYNVINYKTGAETTKKAKAKTAHSVLYPDTESIVNAQPATNKQGVAPPEVTLSISELEKLVKAYEAHDINAVQMQITSNTSPVTFAPERKQTKVDGIVHTSIDNSLIVYLMPCHKSDKDAADYANMKAAFYAKALREEQAWNRSNP